MSTDLSKLTKDQLKQMLRDLNQKVGGNKPELIERLQAAMNGVPAPTTKAPKTVVDVPVKVSKPKVVKTPTEKLTEQIRSSKQTLGVSLAVLLNVYDAGDLYDQLMELVNDRSEVLPQEPELPSVEGMNESDLKKMKVVDLRKILKDRGEKLVGKKDELIARILNPTQKQEILVPENQEEEQIEDENQGEEEEEQTEDENDDEKNDDEKNEQNEDEENEEEEEQTEEDEGVSLPTKMPLELPTIPGIPTTNFLSGLPPLPRLNK